MVVGLMGEPRNGPEWPVSFQINFRVWVRIPDVRQNHLAVWLSLF
jgi:hypothetical protein